MSHVGLCVSDLERAQRFYSEGLGFEVQERLTAGSRMAAFAEVPPPIRVTSQFLTKDGTRLELLGWEAPGVQGAASSARNQVGFTHLCFFVEDMEAVAANLVSLGGSVLEETRTAVPTGQRMLMVADPDGTRIELLQLS